MAEGRSESEVLPKVDLADAFIINNFVRGSRGQYPALADDVGAVANAQCFAHVVIGDHDPDIALLEKPDDLLDVEHREWIDPGERLVEQNEARPCGERARDFDPAALPARKAERGGLAQVRDRQVLEQRI